MHRCVTIDHALASSRPALVSCRRVLLGAAGCRWVLLGAASAGGGLLVGGAGWLTPAAVAFLADQVASAERGIAYGE
jgi:hypothetical protein